LSLVLIPLRWNCKSFIVISGIARSRIPEKQDHAFGVRNAQRPLVRGCGFAATPGYRG